MEAISVSSNTIVPQALDGGNYEIWSSFMEDYLLGQGLWKVIIEAEPEVEAAEKEIWREKNSMALHAIKVCCGPKVISKVVEIKSAKEAWDLLAAAAAADAAAAAADAAAAAADAAAAAADAAAAAADAAAAASAAAAITSEQEIIDYDPFIEAVKDEDWGCIESFLDCHPGSESALVFTKKGTALHYLVECGISKRITTMLVNRMKADDLEILNEEGYTAFAVGASKWYPGILKLLEDMISKNEKLPNIGMPTRLPVTAAALGGMKKTTRYLYSLTDTNLLNPENDAHGITLLINCIENNIFDIASKLVEQFPNTLHQQHYSGAYPLFVFAQTFSVLTSERRWPNISSQSKHWWSNFGEYGMKFVQHRLGRDNGIPKVFDEAKLTKDQARAFLQLVCTHLSTCSFETLINIAYDAMVKATEHGNIEFINQMLAVNQNLIWAHSNGVTLFSCAIKYRREKVFSLVYAFMEKKDSIFDHIDPKSYNNMLHVAAMLAPSHVLDRTSGPALQVQAELQWFQEIWNLTNPQDRESCNEENLTPRELFTKSHAKLIDDGEKAMKDTAASSTVVGALIVTMMFAATFTIPGGNNQDGYPLFLNEGLFKTFIICDAQSLYSSATSVLIFLGILTSRYAEDDFLLLLPRKLMLGISTLFFSIATMMVTFCAALAIILNGRLQFILPIVLLAFVPVILFLSSIFPLLSKIYKSTFGPSIFDKNTKLPSKKEYMKIKNNPSSVVEDSKKKEGENITNISSGVAEELPTKKKEDVEIVNTSSGDQLV